MRIEGQNNHNGHQRRGAENLSNGEEANRLERGRERGDRSREVAPGRRTDAAERGDRGQRADREVAHRRTVAHRDEASITREGLQRLRQERQGEGPQRPGQERPERTAPEQGAAQRPEIPTRLARVLRRLVTRGDAPQRPEGPERTPQRPEREPVRPEREPVRPEPAAAERPERTPRRNRRLGLADLRTAPVATPAPSADAPAVEAQALEDSAQVGAPVVDEPSVAPAPEAGLARQLYTLAKKLGILPTGPPQPLQTPRGDGTTADGPGTVLKAGSQGPVEAAAASRPEPSAPVRPERSPERPERVAQRQGPERPERVAQRQGPERPERVAPEPKAPTSPSQVTGHFERYES